MSWLIGRRYSLAARRAAELRVFGLGVPLFGRWRGAFDRYLAEVTSARLRVSLYRLLSAALQELTGLAALLFLILLALQGNISLGMLVALLYALVHCSPDGRVNLLRDIRVDRIRLLIFARLREFLALESELKPQRGSAKQLRPLRRGVRFHNVSFTYPGADRTGLGGNQLYVVARRVAGVGGREWGR